MYRVSQENRTAVFWPTLYIASKSTAAITCSIALWYTNALTSPQSNLRKARRSSANKTSSKLMRSHTPSMLTVKSRSMLKHGHHASPVAQWACRIFLIHFCTWISRQPPLRSWTWLYHKKGNLTQNPTVYSAYGNTAYFSHTSRMHFSASLGLLKPMHAEMTKNVTNHARNRPFPLRHVDFHQTDECLGLPHSPCQTTARSLYALPHNDATESSLVTMGRRKFTPKLPLPLRRSPPKSNTPIPASGSNQPFCHNTHVRTDGDDECSIPIPLRSAILIASDALTIAQTMLDGRQCISVCDMHICKSSLWDWYGLQWPVDRFIGMFWTDFVEFRQKGWPWHWK